jgi:hypothetical protein
MLRSPFLNSPTLSQSPARKTEQRGKDPCAGLENSLGTNREKDSQTSLEDLMSLVTGEIATMTVIVFALCAVRLEAPCTAIDLHFYDGVDLVGY